MSLSSNKLPRGLVTLEGIFNLDDQSKNKVSNLAIGKDDYVLVIVAKGKALDLGKVCSEIDQEIFVSLCQKFNDTFSWTYEDLKGFDPSLFQHIIDFSENTKLVRQKQRPMNPRIEPLMRKELTKLIEANIVFPIKHSS